MYIALIFSNLSQVSGARAFFSNTERLNSLLPYIKCTDNLLRKGGVIGLLRNICFDSSQHIWLLEEMELLPTILTPLAGPEEFDDEETDKLPIELQVN